MRDDIPRVPSPSRLRAAVLLAGAIALAVAGCGGGGGGDAGVLRALARGASAGSGDRRLGRRNLALTMNRRDRKRDEAARLVTVAVAALLAGAAGWWLAGA